MVGGQGKERKAGRQAGKRAGEWEEIGKKEEETKGASSLFPYIATYIDLGMLTCVHVWACRHTRVMQR